MGGRAVFINVGFDPTASLDIVSAMTLTSGDLLVAVYPKSSDDVSRLRSEHARAQINSHVNMLRTLGRNIEYRELELDLKDLVNAIDVFLDFIKEVKKEGRAVYFELTGGVRTITIIMVLLSIWFPNFVDELTFVVEVTRERVSLPVISPIDISRRPVKEVIRLMSSYSSVRRRDLCRELRVSESSVSRAISFLKKRKIVDEKLRVVSLSEKFRTLSSIFKHFGEEISDS